MHKPRLRRTEPPMWLSTVMIAWPRSMPTMLMKKMPSANPCGEQQHHTIRMCSVAGCRHPGHAPGSIDTHLSNAASTSMLWRHDHVASIH